MIDNTLELAENKLLLLYIFYKIKLPISNNQITEIVLKNNLMNYFMLQQYISELVNSNFLKYIVTDGKHRLLITEKGDKVLSLFQNRISESKLKTIDSYLEKQLPNIKKEITVTADYTIEKDNSFIVNLKAVENDSILLDLKVNVGSNKQARKLCAKWKNNSSDLYSRILNLLINS